MFELDKKKIFSLIFLFFCGVGLTWQVTDISIIYFEYRILTELLIEIPSTIVVPDLSICARYTDLIDDAQLNRAHNTSLVKQMSAQYIRTVQRMATVEDIFHFTPLADENVFKSCLERTVDDYNFYNTTPEGCYRKFDVTKFVFQEYLCYNFHRRQPTVYRYRDLAYAILHPGMVYAVELNTSHFATADLVKGVVHSSDALPYKSMALTRGIDRGVDLTTGRAKFNYFKMAYSMVFTSLLPRPYASQCLNRSSSACFRDCLQIATQSKYNKLPFTSILPKPVKARILNVFDLKNESVSADIIKMEGICIGACAEPACNDDYTLTSFVITEGGRNDVPWMTFEVSLPTWPTFTVNAKPRMMVNDFIVYAVSCVGTWYGLSVFDFNPAHMGQALRRKMAPQSGPGRVGQFCSNTRILLSKKLHEDFL
ncbi:hypothetical protein HDE_02173 [Halotydeus destructor]|nr:hypothetical protein HDE_02173 [Halotydeus destructor]